MTRPLTRLAVAAAALGLALTVAPPASAIELLPPPTSQPPVTVTDEQLHAAWVDVDEAAAVTGLRLSRAPFTGAVHEVPDCLQPGDLNWVNQTIYHPQCWRYWETPIEDQGSQAGYVINAYNLMIVAPTEEFARQYVASWASYAKADPNHNTIYTDTPDRFSRTYNFTSDGLSPDSMVFTHVGNVIIAARCTGYKATEQTHACSEAIADRQVRKAAALAEATKDQATAAAPPSTTPTTTPATPSAACLSAKRKLAYAKRHGTAREIRLAKRRVATACR